MNAQENSKWNVDIPWQEGTEEDFVELREHLEKVKMKEDKVEDSDSESEEDTEVIEEFVNIGEKSKNNMNESSDEYEDNTDEDKLVERFHNQYQDNESESDDEPEVDPGPEHPSRRLLWAAQHNQMEILKAIVKDKPGLLSAKDEDGYTPLHRASYSGHVDVSCSISSRASYSGHVDAMLVLLNAGADPHATTIEGWTPLHSACRWNQAAAAELLLAHGAPLNLGTQGGQTALHLAAFGTNSRETLELLLTQPGVDGTLVNCQGDTARDISMRNSLLYPLFDAILPSPVQKYKEK